MSLARGELIAFLDHDDIWEPHHLEVGLSQIQKKNGDISYSTVQTFQTTPLNKAGLWGPTPADLAQFPQTLFERNFITPSSVIITRSLQNRLGPLAPMRCCEDHDYWLRAATLGARFVTSDTITVNYRTNTEGKLSSKTELMLKQDIEVQKRNWYSKAFLESSKRKGIANNYFLLSCYYRSQGMFKSWIYLLLSVYWYPFSFSRALKFLYSSWNPLKA